MISRVADPAFQKMLSGFSATTAEVLYHMPDHPDFLQSFLWQFEDIAPQFPRLHRFLDHWRTEVEATIHSCLLYTSPSPRDKRQSRMPSSA